MLGLKSSVGECVIRTGPGFSAGMWHYPTKAEDLDGFDLYLVFFTVHTWSCVLISVKTLLLLSCFRWRTFEFPHWASVPFVFTHMNLQLREFRPFVDDLLLHEMMHLWIMLGSRVRHESVEDVREAEDELQPETHCIGCTQWTLTGKRKKKEKEHSQHHRCCALTFVFQVYYS